MKYQFANNKNHPIQVPDRNGKMVHFAKGEKKTLDDFFRRYVPKYLSVIKAIHEDNAIVVNRKAEGVKSSKPSGVRIVKPTEARRANAGNNIVKRVRTVDKVSGSVTITRSGGRNNKRIVGKAGVVGRSHATEFSVSRIKENSIAISNDIGIGILSFNRLKSLIHLVESIRKHTDLNRTTIFISDESTDPKVWEWISQQKDVVGFHSERGGIAANSNRLLRCLSRFKYKMILNDDVEVLREGWDSFYFKAMERTGFKHFCYYQNGVYGASRPRANPNKLVPIVDKPHGAVLAIHDDAFRAVGYFDEDFGQYGFEHVDYSSRINRAVHRDHAYYDVEGSDSYFRIYDDTSSDPNKHENYKKAKEYYNKIKNDNSRVRIEATDKSVVPGITCVIPFRDMGRAKCVEAVVNNIKAQRYPEIEIILAEQDDHKKMHGIPCISHILVKNFTPGMQFCKSVAFNEAIFRAKFENIVLHDADMLVRSDYSRMIAGLLVDYESVHIGKTVCYMEKESTDRIIRAQAIDESTVSSDRVVNYYEGGSLAMTRSAYHRIGGFCEKFIGYGCEDTEFYFRMINGTKSYTVRSIDLFHLWHGRTSGWEVCHDRNKKLQDNLFKRDKNSVRRELSDYLTQKYGEWQ